MSKKNDNNSLHYKNAIHMLYEISDALKPGRDFGDVIRSVLKIMSSVMGIHRAMVTILNRKTGEIFIEESFGLSDDEISRGKYQLGEGITGKVVETGKPMIVHNISKEPRFLNKTNARKNICKEDMAFISVPIRTSTEVIGTLSADRKFTKDMSLEEDHKILTITAAMISRAVRLHQAVHEENLFLLNENKRLQKELYGRYKPENIIGNSNSMRSVFELIKKISGIPTTVLILGESGVGKELVAEAIHRSSLRNEKPFVKINCAALPENLIESEMFGYEKGAFTGAASRHSGKFLQANGGSIFLDEIGELSLSAQSKLLRVLQNQELERIGGESTIKVDVRVIAATNKDLEESVKKGIFREDLYYRLNVFPILVPPLRERKVDIPILADFFIKKYSIITRKTIKRISTPAIDMLMAYHWPGNVRELENCIERAIILSDDEVIHGYQLPPSLQMASPAGKHSRRTLQAQLDTLEYELIIEELKKSNGNMTKISKELGLTMRQVGCRIKKYGIDISKFKKALYGN